MDELAIIKRVTSGDDEAYGVLIETYQRGLIRYCYVITKDIDMAEDIAQEAFISAYEQLNKYDPKYKFSTWLYKIAHNKALKSLRKPPALPLEEDFEIPFEDQTQEKLDVEVRESTVRDAVASLPSHYQMAVNLHYWESKDYLEIAEIMNVPATTIKTWLYRARQQVKENCHELAR